MTSNSKTKINSNIASKAVKKQLVEVRRLLAKFNYQQAIPLLEEITEFSPGVSEALYLLGICLINESKYLESATYLTKAIEIEPGNAEFYSMLGLAYDRIGSLTNSIENYLKALDLNGASFTALTGLGDVFYNKQKYISAKEYYCKAVEVKASSTEAQLKLALILSNLGEYKKALFHAEKAIRQSPKNPNSYGICARIHLVGGNVEDAKRLYKKAIDLDSAGNVYYSEYVSVEKIRNKDDPIIKRMEKALQSSLSTNNRRCTHFALGQAYNDCGQWNKAFDNFSKGNLLIPTSYNQKNKARYYKSIKKVFSHSIFQKFKGFGNSDVSPVFIVGMPRSGSTLIDQVLSSHSDVYSIGESNTFPEVDVFINNLLGIEYPGYISKLTNEIILSAGKNYLDQTQENSVKNQLVVDKMLFNFMYLGLVAILFPKAKIIHSKRSPLDTSLSCFSIYFVSNGSDNEWSSSLDNIGFSYRLYDDLMNHWKDVLPLPILDVQYEGMVENLEDNARKIIDFCGLEWEPQCLEFYKSKRSVQTASVNQVRQPIYKGSVSRWPPYAKHLGPLVEQLGDLVTEDYEQLKELGCEFKIKKQGLFKRFF